MDVTGRFQSTTDEAMIKGGQVSGNVAMIASAETSSVAAVNQLDRSSVSMIAADQPTGTLSVIAKDRLPATAPVAAGGQLGSRGPLISDTQLTSRVPVIAGSRSAKPPVVPRRCSSLESAPAPAAGAPSLTDGAAAGHRPDSAPGTPSVTSGGRCQDEPRPTRAPPATGKGGPPGGLGVGRQERGRPSARTAGRSARAGSVPLPDPELQYVDDRYDF